MSCTQFRSIRCFVGCAPTLDAGVTGYILNTQGIAHRVSISI
jgi:hypothetical protein